MNIVITSPSFSKNKHLVKEVLRFFPNAKFNTEGTLFTKKELIEFLKGYECAIVGLDKIDSEVLDNCPELKYISKYGVGLDNIDLEECEKRDIGIGWTGGVNKLSVAEMTLGFMLSLSRNLYTTSNELKNGIWNKSGGFQLSGKTVGIIGIGHIGKEVARLLKPFGCKILVNDIINQTKYYQENGLIETTKDEIFKNADVITIHTPLTFEMKYLINKETLSMMKPNAIVINTARGGIINQDDLKWALKNDIISGAAIDAYEVEPPEDEEFVSLPNLITTPHIGGNAQEAVKAMGLAAIENVIKYCSKD